MDFVIVGTGRMGRSHILAARELGHTLVGACDRSAEQIARIGEEFSLPADRRFTDAEELFRKVQAPLVLIAATADTHADLVVRAAANGARFILCEKPMATSLADCDRMLAACRDKGVKLAVNHQMPFMPQYLAVKRLLEGDRLGPLGSMNVVGGCFGMAMNGSHYFEAFRFLTGSRIKSISAWFAPDEIGNPRGPQFRDASGALMALGEDGRRFLMSAGSDQGHGMTVTYATAWGHIFCDELEGVLTITARKPEHKDMPSTRYGMPWERWEERFQGLDNVGATRPVIEALTTGGDYPDGEHGRDVIRCLVAAYLSSESGGRLISLDELGGAANRVFSWA
jgi:predicted dehydrogenase